MSLKDSRFDYEVGDVVYFEPTAPQDLILDRMAGGFGAIYIVKSMDSYKKITVLKTIRSDLNFSEKIYDEFVSEAKLWLELPSSSHIVPAYVVRRLNGKPFIRIQYVPPISKNGSSLEALLTDVMDTEIKKRMREMYPHVCEYLLQIISALACIEREAPDFSHGDIKPSNILIKQVFAGKLYKHCLALSDFGLAKALKYGVGEYSRTYAGDYRYLAPEVLEGKPASCVTDIYSIGCLMFRMITGAEYQFINNNSNKLIQTNLSVLNKFKKQIGNTNFDGMTHILESCLNLNTAGRPKSFSELYQIIKDILKLSGFEYGEIQYQIPERDKPPKYIYYGQEYPLHKYLTNDLALDFTSANLICKNLSNAANYRALGKIKESESILFKILEKYPKFAPAIAGVAHGKMVSNDLSASYYLYIKALAQYFDDNSLKEKDILMFASVCANLCQLSPPLFQKDSLKIVQGIRFGILALSITPKETRILLGIGNCLMCLNRTHEAIHVLRYANQLNPTNNAILFALKQAETILSKNDLSLKRDIILEKEKIFDIGKVEKKANEIINRYARVENKKES